MRGVESPFQFLAYKIDTLELQTTKDLRTLLFTGVLGPAQIKLTLQIRNPSRIKADNSYIGGLEVQFSLYLSSDQTDANRLAAGKAGVLGFFKVLGEGLDEETEKNLVRVQIPTILFPYLRSAITSITINAGFPGVVIPLINVQELARQAGENIQIQDLGTAPGTSAAPASSQSNK